MTPASTAVSSDASPALEPDVHARAPHATEHALAVRNMFDRISPTYDTLNRTLSLGIDRAWRRRAVRELLRALPAGEIMDLCAGTLDLSQEIGRHEPTRTLAAVDLSPEMLAHGATKVDPTRVTTHVGDATALPFESARFIGAIAGFGIRNVSEPERAAREVLRVLRPGGRYVTLEFFRPVRWSTRLFHRSYGAVLLPMVGRLISGDAEAYRYLSRSMQGFLTRTEYEAMLCEVGFVDVRAFDLLWGIASVVIGTRQVA